MAFQAVIDESGHRALTTASSDHFVMSAVVYADGDHAQTTELLAQLRADLGRLQHHRIHWQNLKSHSHRLHAAQTVGGACFLTISSVVVCKRLLMADPLPHE